MLSGLLLGLLIVVLQDKFQFVLINGMDAYPVLIKKLDILYISITVLTIGAIAAWFPAASALNKRKLLPS
jgi:ABC-type lipoprotein release transport system permease subunit